MKGERFVPRGLFARRTQSALIKIFTLINTYFTKIINIRLINLIKQMSITFINFIALLNIKFASGSFKFTLPLRCKSSEKLVELIFEKMYISSFIVSRSTAPMRKNGSVEKTVTIERLPSNTYMYFELVSTPTRVITKSQAELKHFEKYFCGKLIMSTDAGLMFGEDCVKRSIGGVVVCALSTHLFKETRKMRIAPEEYLKIA